MRVYHLLAVVFVGMGLACGQSPSGKPISNAPPATVAPAAKPAGKKTYTHEEFIKFTTGKTQEQIIAVLGKPDEIHDNVHVYYGIIDKGAKAMSSVRINYSGKQVWNTTVR